MASSGRSRGSPILAGIGRSRIFDVEYYLTGQVVYDALEDYIARTAPERLEGLRAHLEAIRPPTSNTLDYVEQLSQVADRGHTSNTPGRLRAAS